MRSFSIVLSLVAVLGCGLVNAQQSLVQSQGQVIFFSGASTGTVDGDLAPGCGGDRFGGGAQNSAVIGEDGKAFFQAQLVSNTGTVLAPANIQRAYFYGDSRGNLVKILRGGDPEPSGQIPGAILSTSTNGIGIGNAPRIAANGLMMFSASVWDFTPAATVTATNDTLLYVGTPGGFSILARENDVAPGTGGAYYANFGTLNNQSTCINSAGWVLFQSTLVNNALANPQVVTGNNAAWFGGQIGNVQMLLRKSEILPSGEQINTTGLGFLSQMNSNGHVLLDVSYLVGSGTPAVTAANDKAVWICVPGGSRTQIVREGDPTPIPGTFFGNAANSWAYGSGSSTFNVAGQFLDNSPLTGAVTVGVDDRALFLLSAAGHSVVYRKGDLAPGVQGANPGATLDTANDSSLCLNDSGMVCFEATLANGGVTTANDSGIWIGTPGNLTLVCREGDVAPGTGGLLFGQTTGVQLLMNGAGQLFFQNTLTGAAPGSLTGSTWMWDPVVGLHALFRPGDLVEVQPGIFRTPYTAGGVQFTNGDGRPLSFANDGTVVTKLSMTDGTSYGSQALVTVRIGSLTGLPGKISELAGGTHKLYLNAGLAHAGETFVVAGSASGTNPGIQIGAFNIPLNFDSYTQFTLDNANLGPYVNTFGFLDAQGRAQANVVIPPGLTGFTGVVVHHAYGVLDLGNQLVFASEPARLEIIP